MIDDDDAKLEECSETLEEVGRGGGDQDLLHKFKSIQLFKTNVLTHQ